MSGQPDPTSEGSPADAQTPPGGAHWSEAPGLIARGLCMGIAEVVPGVSGGTMALILGIYQRLVDAIRSLTAKGAGHLLARRWSELTRDVGWRLLVLIGTGQLLGIIVCLKVVKLPHLLEQPATATATYGLFFGLVLGSALLLGRDVLREGAKPGRIVAFLGGISLGLAASLAVPEMRNSAPWFIFLCGAVAICAMILPGISGSFVLLLLGQYAFVLGGVSEVIHPEGGGGLQARLDPFLSIVVPFGLGAVVGILSFARFLSWLMHRHRAGTLAFMTGLLFGSLWVLWPFQERIFETIHDKRQLVGSSGHLLPGADGTSALTGLLVLVGFVTVWGLDRYAAGKADQRPADGRERPAPA